jgi:hypothetical protein
MLVLLTHPYYGLPIINVGADRAVPRRRAVSTAAAGPPCGTQSYLRVLSRTSDMTDRPDESTARHGRTSRRQGEGTERSGTLVLSDEKAYVGDTVTFKGRNFPPGEAFDVVWHSVQGSWGVLQANEIVGPQFRPRSETIFPVEADDSGAFDAEWTVPDEYGGSHRVEVQAEAAADDEDPVASAELELVPWFELDRTEARMGETFTLRGYGLGPDVMQNNYQVAWDNGYVGFLTGVQNRGTATAEVRAVGPPGEHVIQVWRNYRGVPYLLNNTQSPFGSVAGGRQTAWRVDVSEPDSAPRTAWMDDLFDESPIDLHYRGLADETDAELEISPQCGQAGTTAIITGRQFEPNTEVDLVWYRHEGHEPRGTASTPDPKIGPVAKPDVLPTVTSDADGRFQVEVTIPTDIGSTRPITAAVGGRQVAATGFMMQPSIERFEPRSGPVGTEIEIELSGIGWTAYENAPYFVYDNKPLGYLCGTGGDDETGTVNPVLHATGEPGWHFIDAYPSLFWVEDDHPDFQLKPHLSYLDNHPVRPLPAFHFAFEVTE